MTELYRLIKNHAVSLFERLQESNSKKIFNLSIPHHALLLQFHEKPFIVIEDSPENAIKLYQDFIFFRDAMAERTPKSALYFPPPPNPENTGRRCKVFYELSSNGVSSFITSLEALKTGFEISSIKDNVLHLKKGLSLERENLNATLDHLGYKESSLVVEKGDYARRGWLFDIYPVTEDFPIRVEFFGDDIDTIRTFDIESQRSVKEIAEIDIFPAFEGEPFTDVISELSKLYELDIFCETSTCDDLLTTLEDRNVNLISISHLPFINDGIDSGAMSLRGLGIMNDERKAFEDIIPPIAGTDKRLLMVFPSESQAQRVKEILFEGGLITPVVDRKAVLQYDVEKCITTGNLSSGLNVADFLILTGREIFAERTDYRPLKKSRLTNLFAKIEDLYQGDFIVHNDHGIGIFAGLRMQTIEDYEEELVIIEYAEGDRLYMPTYSIDKIKKFSASEGHVPNLSRLGTKRWQNTKQRVKEGIKEMAQKLLSLYAERKVSKGFVFSDDTPMHREFDEFFPYEETDDQLKAFEIIKKYMTTGSPMDMLLCGDVGFGKTEVAMRAAFRAVYDGKQAAVIVPTTLLAEQHYRTFRDRFSAFPVKIDYLSRFKNSREIKKCLTALSKGEIDIIIGTHILLKKDIRFSDLGLIVIDEEHRFGVSQKEKLKELKSGVDVLTLTATPIPRTLHLSLSGVREMTTIETPPEQRLGVKTFVTTFSEKMIKDAVDKELKRGGQVFYVHNRIRDISKVADSLKRLMPYIRVDAAHGRMRDVELEDIMLKFLDKKTDVLVCTAIIGSGLDITNANTLIVNRADTFGLSDLYQLRGRVGRASTQAYAYFLIPGEEIITKEAKKRLHALQDMSYLGAGLRLALKDLEIRGAGNMLGREQSGHIHKVGFDMYLEMLDKAASELKGEVITDDIEPQIRFRSSAFIPEDYIPDITLRLSIYRRISSAKSANALMEIRDEIIDRFGMLPSEAINLLNIMKIKLSAKRLYINKILDMGGKIRYFFITDPENVHKIPQDFFDTLLKNLLSFTSGKNAMRIRFHPDGFELDTRGKQPDEAIKFSEEILQRLLDLQNKC